jgi:hypothetical protein
LGFWWLKIWDVLMHHLWERLALDGSPLVKRISLVHLRWDYLKSLSLVILFFVWISSIHVLGELLLKTWWMEVGIDGMGWKSTGRSFFCLDRFDSFRQEQPAASSSSWNLQKEVKKGTVWQVNIALIPVCSKCFVPDKGRYTYLPVRSIWVWTATRDTLRSSSLPSGGAFPANRDAERDRNGVTLYRRTRPKNLSVLEADYWHYTLIHYSVEDKTLDSLARLVGYYECRMLMFTYTINFEKHIAPLPRKTYQAWVLFSNEGGFPTDCHLKVINN